MVTLSKPAESARSAAAATTRSVVSPARTMSTPADVLPKGCPAIPGGRTTTATAPRRVVGAPEYIQYADAPPPCDAPHLTPRADPPGITGQPLDPLALPPAEYTQKPAVVTASRDHRGLLYRADGGEW